MYKFLNRVLIILIVIGLYFNINLNIVSANSFFEGLQKTGREIGYSGATEDIPLAQRIGQIIGVLLGFIGVIFLCLAIYGGYTWMMARGNEQEVSKAKNIIKNALIGIVIVLAAYAVTMLIQQLWLKAVI